MPKKKPSDDKTAKDLRLADDPASFDQDHKINAYFRDHGIGLVPRQLKLDKKNFSATFGWHLFDDGKRTLVFDSGNKIQVNLRLFDSEGETVDQIIPQLITHMEQGNPGILHVTAEYNRFKFAAFRNMTVNGEKLEQAYIFHPKRPRPNLQLEARVTAPPADISRAVDLAGFILTGLKFPD